ncbi:MAG: hypothetical protein K2P58_04830 [Hyphomonadaceae bacterium]|nr:hypothetical protein [Hyphomonadaceae bacterium]
MRKKVACVSPFRTGQMWLAEAQLYHYKARAYLPQLGRFAQTDPIGMAGGVNLYAYVANDPVNLVDPSGLLDCYYRRERMWFVYEYRDANGGLGVSSGTYWGWALHCESDGSGLSQDQLADLFRGRGNSRQLLGLETPGPDAPRELSPCEQDTLLNQGADPQDVASTRIWDGRTPTWLTRGAGAITLGRNVYFRPGELTTANIGHEVGHVGQNRRGELNVATYALASAWSQMMTGNIWAGNVYELQAERLRKAIIAAGVACADAP